MNGRKILIFKLLDNSLVEKRRDIVECDNQATALWEVLCMCNTDRVRCRYSGGKRADQIHLMIVTSWMVVVYYDIL